jgi:rhodanese-related sulfurtransferase
MKKLMHYFLVAMVIPAIMLTGCKDDNPDPVTGNYETLVTYMAANNMDLPTLLTSWVIAPTLVADGGIVDADAGYTIPGYHVIDIRGEEDFKAGHIKGSHNTTLTNIVSKANELGKDKPILVVCYSGQTASRGVMALRLSGFPDAKVMKFGFSYWTSETYGTDQSFDKWSPKVSNVADGNANWSMGASPALPSNPFPAWTSSSTDGAAILAERVSAMLAAGGWGTTSTDVLTNPANYNIYNFWTEDAFNTIGHYTGAYLYTTISFETVKALPQSEQCEIYCYTGQTSSYAVAWLQVLGYNAKSIGYGVNSLRHDAVDTYDPKVAWHHSLEYPFETTIK